MSDFQYDNAPITEAVVQFKFKAKTSDRLRKKAIKKLKLLYPTHTPQTRKTIHFFIQQSGESKSQNTLENIIDRFASVDMTEQLIIDEDSFLISRLAPYTGWREFEDRIRRDWEAWRTVLGATEISSIGMRYINRIDMPIENNIVRHEDYVKIYPAIPEILDPCNHYSVNLKKHFDDIGSVLTLNSAVVPCPVPNNMAIVIDLDLIKKFDSPPQDDEIFKTINLARDRKNEIFEACITDKARELFKK